MRQWLDRLEKMDLLFLVLTIVLLFLGLTILYSSTCVMAAEKFGDSFYYLKRQIVFATIGIVALLMLQIRSSDQWCRLGAPMVIGSVIVFSLLFVPGLGEEANGAVRWLRIAGFQFQPSEFAKIACLLYMSSALSKKGDQVKSFTYGILPMLVVSGSMLLFLLAQPDLGNAVVIALITLAMLFLAGARISYLALGVLAALPILYMLVMGAEYRKKRLLAFLDPWHDPQNSSYQIVQSFTGFFKGGLFGQGLGNSQEKLYFLPEIHTDFIGSVLAEELGFIGFCALIGLFAMLTFRGFMIAARARTRSGYLLAAGCSFLLGSQIILNLSIIMGLLPTKGLPLPFLSHGGSSLICTLILCGLILSVSRANRLDSIS